MRGLGPHTDSTPQDRALRDANHARDSPRCKRTTTSGCVRASVIDAFSYNLKVSVVEECVFDRGQASHKINLFDMAMKYADVISLQETVEYVRGLPNNLFAPAL